MSNEPIRHAKPRDVGRRQVVRYRVFQHCAPKAVLQRVIFNRQHRVARPQDSSEHLAVNGLAESGVDYLDQTALKYRIFRDVWAVRTLLLSAKDLPPLENPAFYGFAAP